MSGRPDGRPDRFRAKAISNALDIVLSEVVVLRMSILPFGAAARYCEGLCIEHLGGIAEEAQTSGVVYGDAWLSCCQLSLPEATFKTPCVGLETRCLWTPVFCEN